MDIDVLRLRHIYLVLASGMSPSLENPLVAFFVVFEEILKKFADIGFCWWFRANLFGYDPGDHLNFNFVFVHAWYCALFAASRLVGVTE